MNKGLLLMLCLTATQVFGQHSWVYFVDDDACTQIESVNAAYLITIQEFEIEIVGASTWLNAVCVKGTPKFLEALSFVDRVETLGHYTITRHEVDQTTADFNYGNSDWQLSMLQLDSFHKMGYTGKGVTIGLFDAGFYKADTVHAFDSLWDQGRIKGYWDFLTDDTSIFWEYDGHGKYVLSIVGANWPDSMMGSAPHANFLLARTEDVKSETHLEEYAWVKAMEWAEKQDVDIIHSSLGYSIFDTLQGDYTYADMDGKSTLITRATDIAFSKGIFITNSAGNEGDDDWHYITAPCDGFHVLCVGSVDSARNHSAFSSYGPSADGRVKPDVVAMGEGVTYINNQANLRTGNGTSFSGPLIAGFVACLKQAWPNTTNQQLYDAIVKSADRYLNPDTAYGYGLPNILRADSLLALTASVPGSGQVSDVNVYPNPASAELQIVSQRQILEISILDLTGRIVSHTLLIGHKTASVDLTDIASNMYMIQVKFKNGGLYHEKLMVNKP